MSQQNRVTRPVGRPERTLGSPTTPTLRLDLKRPRIGFVAGSSFFLGGMAVFLDDSKNANVEARSLLRYAATYLSRIRHVVINNERIAVDDLVKWSGSSRALLVATSLGESTSKPVFFRSARVPCRDASWHPQ